MFRRNVLVGSSFLVLSSFLAIPFAPTVAGAALDISLSHSPSSSGSTSQTISLSSFNHPVRRDPDPAKDRFVKPEPFGITNDFSNNTVYPVGATLEVEWLSEWQQVDLSLCQPTTGDTVGRYTLLRQTLSKGFHLTFDGKETDHMSGFGSTPIPNVYFLQLVQTNTLNPTIMSHYFNVTKGNGATGTDSSGSSNGTDTTSLGGSNSTTSATASSVAGSTDSASPTSTSDAAAPATGWDALSSGVHQAVYILVAVIGAGLAGAGIFWLIMRTRARKRAAKLGKVGIVESTSTLTSPIPLQEMHSDSFVHETGQGLPHEISSHEIPMELPAEVPGLAVSTYDDDGTGGPWAGHHAQPHDALR